MSHWRYLPYTLASLCFLMLASAALAASDAIPLNQNGLTGSWYDPQTSGQGFEAEVYPDLLSPVAPNTFIR